MIKSRTRNSWKFQTDIDGMLKFFAGRTCQQDTRFETRKHCRWVMEQLRQEGSTLVTHCPGHSMITLSGKRLKDNMYDITLSACSGVYLYKRILDTAFKAANIQYELSSVNVSIVDFEMNTEQFVELINTTCSKESGIESFIETLQKHYITSYHRLPAEKVVILEGVLSKNHKQIFGNLYIFEDNANIPDNCQTIEKLVDTLAKHPSK